MGGGDRIGLGGGGAVMSGLVRTEGSQSLSMPFGMYMGVASPVSVPPGLFITKELSVPVMVKGPVGRSLL